MINRWSSFSYILTFIILLPIIFVINHSFGSETNTMQHLKETVLLGYITDTLILVFSVGFLTLILGVGTAYITTFYHFKFVSFFVFALALPFMIPTYIMGYIYSDIFGYFNYFHLFLRSIGIKEYFNVLNIYSVIIFMSLALYPYVYLIVKASFEKSKSALLNPALSLGSSRKKLFFKIILPLSRPAIIGSLALVVMETISEYGVTEYYNIKTLTVAIFNTWFGLHDSGSAAYMAVIAMIMVLTVLSIEKYSRGKAKYKIENSNTKVKKLTLKGYKLYLTYFFISMPVIFGFIIPLIWIGVYSFEYASNMLDEKFLNILSNSFFSSGLSAFIIMVLAFFISYTARIYPITINKYLSKIISLGFTMPGAVIVIGIIILFADIDKWLIEHYFTTTLFLSGSLFALIFGYIVRFTAIGIYSVESNLERVSINLNNASRSLGYNYFKTMFKVELPLMRNALLFGFILVFISAIKELPITLVLRPFNYETLATKTYTLANAQMLQEASIYALSIIVISIIPLSIIILKAEK
ncbi:iron ABC transporter permease [Sulfurimonas sp.]|uniref:ABC transporter permease n=1 Tax=Sulfurimonas sp. TaxID=2022749 RepID=UPI002B492768|nr:iron ABC transporter permease [Sulfurimonas sp.]